MNKTTRRIKNNKNFETELGFIDQLNALDKFEVDIQENKDVKAIFSRHYKTFKLEINARLKAVDKPIEYLSFNLNDKIYETKKIGNTSNSTNVITNGPVTFQTTIELKSFQSITFREIGIFKALFPTDIKEINTFHTEFETVTYKSSEREYFYDCLRITLNHRKYDVTQLKYKTIGYYIFECLEEQSYDDFSDACYSIQQAIGFINRLLVGGEKFVFDDWGSFSYSNYIRPTIKGMYSPITSNPYSLLDLDRDIANKYHNNLTRLSLDNLSNLVFKIHNEPEFSIAILVILEATSLRSLLIIPSTFAVIVEQLSKHLSKEEIGLEYPITDPELENLIIAGLQKFLDDNCKVLKNSNIIKLKRRINEINRPINKKNLTNIEKLTRPFEQLGINLTLHDIKIIEHRNDLLHGNILLKTKNVKNEEETDTYMAYVSAKLFTLLSKLILKSIGYNGYVYNQAKYLEKYLNIETGEEYFEKI